VFDEARAARAERFFENLKHTKGEFRGQPFTLLPWERTIVRDVYGTVDDAGLRTIRYVYIEIAKKNGKTELAAGAALYQLFADREANGEVYGCAADRAQARIVFDVAVDMIDQSPALKKRAKLTKSQHLIRDTVSGSFYKVVSAESYTKHGINLSACIFDELHAQPNRDLWDVMTFGAGDARRQPIWWIITTAGDDPDRVSVCWEQHEYAVKLLAGDVVDPTWYPVVYGYDGDDIYNEENWATANPSLGQTFTLETVRAAADKARERPADERLFRWLRLNQWITTKLTTWLPLSLFDETEGAWKRTELAGLECYLGLDLSSTTDLSALCLIFPPQGVLTEWRVIWECWIPADNMRERVIRDRVPYDRWAALGWVTPTEGNVIDYTKIEEKILEYQKLYRIKELVSDPALATMLLQRLMAAGIECLPLPQTFVMLTDPMNLLESMLKNRQMSHEAHPVARWCFGNTSVAKNGQGYIKYVKETKGQSVMRTKRIDLTTAWVCALARARFYDTSISKYETEGLLVL
jgi:phage terminase large subunit-like protein